MAGPSPYGARYKPDRNTLQNGACLTVAGVGAFSDSGIGVRDAIMPPSYWGPCRRDGHHV